MAQQAIASGNDQLLQDVRSVLSTTEDLLQSAGEEGGAVAKELRQKIGANLEQAKRRLVEAEQAVVGKAKVAAKVTDEYVHDNPWKSIGFAAFLGLLIGMLIARR